MSRIYNADTTHKDGKAELHVGLIDEDEFIVERIDNKIEFRNAVTNDKISIRGAGIPARLVVTAITGSTVTVTKGSFEMSEVVTGTTVTFEINELGVYTVKAVKGGDFKSETININTASIFELSLKFANIYGVSWDRTSNTKLSRTDDAALFVDPVAAIGTGSGSSPFDNIYPWSMITRETIDGNVMVKIPKFWVKVTNGSALTVQIADKAIEGFHVSPAHKDRGDGKGERDYIYVSRYTLNSSYKSTSGNASITSIFREDARTNIHNLGANYYQYDYLTYLTILYLYLVEYADWNSQNTIGYGYANDNSAQINTGATDSMTYHTGTAGSSRSANAAIQYRYIENLWGNLCQWVDGIYFADSNIYVIENPNNFSDTANGTKLSFTRATSDGYISDLGSDTTNPEYIYPTANNGSKTTYITDYNWYKTHGGTLNTGVTLNTGGYYSEGSACGVMCLYGTYGATNSSSSIGMRSIYLP